MRGKVLESFGSIEQLAVTAMIQFLTYLCLMYH